MKLKILIHKSGVALSSVVVDCYVTKGEAELVVHRKLEDAVEVPRGAWVITHRRTTFTLGAAYSTRDAALAGLRRISAAGLDWSFDELGKVDLAEYKKATEAAFAARFFD